MIVLAGPLLLGHPRQLRRRLTPGKLTAAFAGQLADDAAKIIEVAGQTTQGVRHHGVPLADETKQGRQLRAVHVLARRTVGERAIDGDPVELAGGALVQGARPCVGDSLPGDDALPRRMCQVGLSEPCRDVTINRNPNPNLTKSVAGG